MNIALISQWYPPQDVGGIAKYNYYLANAYIKLGHKVCVVSSLPKDSKTYKANAGVNVYRVKQINFPWFFRKIYFVGSMLRFIRDIIYSFAVRKKLIELNREFKIDVVEYAEINSEGFAHSILGPQNIPFVVRSHTPATILKDYYSKKENITDNPFIHWMERMFIRRALCVTAPSKHLKEIICKIFNIDRSQVRMIPNAIDTVTFFSKPSRNINEKKITLLYVGRIERGKGVFILAKALRGLIKIYGDALKCIFVGPDRTSHAGISTRQEVRDFFSRRGGLKNIDFKGEVSEEELIIFYNRCDIFINPSVIYESFSYTCLEAMSCGKPVVASKIGGIPELVIDGETGFLFEPGDVEELIFKLEILIKDSNKREEMGKKAREKVEMQFDALKVAEKNLEVYRRVCKSL
ncbi:MAG: glycosyltransferase family 4 protein [Omnitrophica bacterium]|nr:glycosyltransferase family 4 protein [Candidatus Omnitrophota bacterium]